MRDPRRLVEEEGTDFERQLLRSAQAEEPPSEVVRRMERALGIAAVGAAVGAGAAASAPAVAAAADVSGAALGASSGATLVGASASPASSGVALAPLALKAVGLLALVLAGAAGSILWVSRLPRPTAGIELASPPAPSAAPVTPAAPAAPPPSHPTRESASGDVREAGGGHTGARAASLARGGALRGEIALIDGARAALAGGSPMRTLRILSRHDARFPRGVLAPEAQALRIEALAANGQGRRAQDLARAFIAAHPDSPLAERIARVRDGEEAP